MSVCSPSIISGQLHNKHHGLLFCGAEVDVCFFILEKKRKKLSFTHIAENAASGQISRFPSLLP